MSLHPTSITEQEIFSQGESLRRSYSHVDELKDAWISFWRDHAHRRIIFTGCGSGYCLAQSAAEATRQYTECAAEAIAGGDLLLNFPSYKKRLDGALVVTMSRSGSTSELVTTLRQARDTTDAAIVSIVAAENTPLEALSDFCLVMPWAFNESVCQTGAVTTFYSTMLHLLGLAAGNEQLLEDLHRAVNDQSRFMSEKAAILEQMKGWEDWGNVVLLADGVAWGLADEGAMAFREMVCAPANCYHILDVRHGPTATVKQDTLVLLLASRGQAVEQRRLLGELANLGAFIIAVGLEGDASEAPWVNIPLEDYSEEAVRGIPFIFIVQWLACRSALSRGLNPDAPPNLSAWVKLP